MFGFVRGVRGRAVVVVLVVAGLLGGVTASSVAAATKTTVTWNMSSLTAGQVESLSAIATTNSHGVKTWSKTGSCTLWPTSRPTTLRMGQGASCTLTLKIAKSGKYRAKTSTKIITRESATTTTVAPTTTTVALTCVPGASCAVGDTGPGGGTIFYVDLTRVEGSQYFEAACAGWSDGTCGGDDLTDPTAEWGCDGTPIIGADGTAIGDGEQNTTDIVTGCATAGIAAGRANDLVLGGQSDWFLPSKDELNEMYIQQTAIGGISPDFYWSSSEYTNYRAWSQYFGHGYQGNYAKDDPEPVRPVRAFTPSDDPNPPTTTTTTTTVALRCANGASCAVGDTGPGGGTIFYVDLTRLQFSQYFEAAPAATEVSRTWATDWNQWSDLYAWETGMVQGGLNTDAIVRQKFFGVSNVAATSAAVYCDSLSTGGKTDWFLPSKDELNEMYIQRTAIGGFSTLSYWSSSAEFYRYNQRFISRAWSQYFGDLHGDQGSIGKNYRLRVRCVRYFELSKTL